jgi:hypothetical protein
MEVQYKKIENYENYEISELGIIRNVKTKHILKPCLNSTNYYVVNLFKDRKSYNVTVTSVLRSTYPELKIKKRNTKCKNKVEVKKDNTLRLIENKIILNM